MPIGSPARVRQCGNNEARNVKLRPKSPLRTKTTKKTLQKMQIQITGGELQYFVPRNFIASFNSNSIAFFLSRLSDFLTSKIRILMPKTAKKVPEKSEKLNFLDK